MEQRRESIEIRAFRGTRRTSVYREHVLSESAFGRILGAGRDLSLLSSLDLDGRHELDKQGSRQLAEEATELRMSGELPELDDDLTVIAELARWCAHASGKARLTIVRR
jgi:predicted house-cleaning noncanonical NTP pyrophosphatase (MazG superfamily)